TRNFNNAYEEEHYLDLLVRAREGWDALGRPDGEPLLRLHGLVTHGDVDIASIRRRLAERGIPAEILDAAEARRRWPGMRFEDDVLWSSDAGVVRASAALLELERRIVEAGGSVRWDTPVRDVVEDDRGVALALEGQTLRADTVVVTAGAWSQRLLRRMPLPRLRVTEETPAHFSPLAEDPWPSFNHYVDTDVFPATIYG